MTRPLYIDMRTVDKSRKTLQVVIYELRKLTTSRTATEEDALVHGKVLKLLREATTDLECL